MFHRERRLDCGRLGARARLRLVSASDRLQTSGGEVGFYRLDRAADTARLEQLPYIVRVFIENVLRFMGSRAEQAHLDALLAWPNGGQLEFPFFPSRVVLQDFTGVPVVADLAAMRSAVARMGGDLKRVNPQVRVDLVIDHSVQVDAFGSKEAFAHNVQMEVQRNKERYQFLRWAQNAFEEFHVVPPGSGIVHQVNLENLATVVGTRDGVAFPDTLVGTDSHTTMIGGVGVLGWGVGGIEAEAAMLGEPVNMLVPEVVGVRLNGQLREGTTATDLVLSLTQLLRNHGVVGRFVEFVGPGLQALTVPDRATVANMSPEYGATEGFFPVDEQTLAYLRGTGRSEDLIDLVERYSKEQGLFHRAGDPEPAYVDLLEFDLGTVEPSLAGPRRPQDRVPLPQVGETFREVLPSFKTSGGGGVAQMTKTPVTVEGRESEVSDGSVVIAAITSCTNTSNPSVMIGAGLLARNAIARGLEVPAHVKTSLAPGSPVVIDYLERSGLLEPLEQLGFYLVGFGCTTCIGNSGPLPDAVARAIDDNSLAVAAVLSGNRNFEGRIHPQVRMSFLASPPLVVAYGLAGTVDIDLSSQPIGHDRDGNDVMLSEIWPEAEEVARLAADAMDPEFFRKRFAKIFEGDSRWKSLEVPSGELYEWDPASTYIQEPPFLTDVTPDPKPLAPIEGARVLVMVGDSVTTDHISPAGAISNDSPAARYLIERGVKPEEFNSYGSRRGNHEVMMRGTFANIRLRNLLASGSEGGVTIHLPDGDQSTIFEASQRYQAEAVPLLVIAGAEYGSGSSRDWAAKGTALLGVRAVIAKTYERIHRSNLVQMGVIPLQFSKGEDASTLGLTGRETFELKGVTEPSPRMRVEVVARDEQGKEKRFETLARLDSTTDVSYIRQGGILPAVLRRLVSA
jgi:aconitate hydratase A / 2-methylisocitrate dehydratase